MGSESELIFSQELGNHVESETELESNGLYHVEDVNSQLLEEIEIGSPSPAVNKSSGLRKWRRRPRDLVKKTSSSLNGDLTASLVHKAAVHVNGGGSSVRPVFATRPDSDQSGGSGPNVRNEVSNLNGGSSVLLDDQLRNGRIGPGKKARAFKLEKENSNSFVGSDARSSNFVFVQGSNNVASKGRQSGMSGKYDEESSDDGHYADKRLNEEAQIAFIKSDAESYDVSLAADNSGEHEGSIDQDPLVESVKGLHVAQMGFEREVQKWRDVGKDDPLTFDDPLHKTLNLKDAKILELESLVNSGDIKAKLEDRLMKLIQTEVEYVVLTTTTKILTEGTLREIKHDDLQQKNVSSQEKKDDKLQTKEDLKKVQNKVFKFTSCFIIMLIILFVTLYLQFAPQNVEVVPT